MARFTLEVFALEIIRTTRLNGIETKAYSTSSQNVEVILACPKLWIWSVNNLHLRRNAALFAAGAMWGRMASCGRLSIKIVNRPTYDLAKAARSAPSSDASAYCGDLDNDQKSLDAGFLCVALHQSGYII